MLVVSNREILDKVIERYSVYQDLRKKMNDDLEKAHQECGVMVALEPDAFEGLCIDGDLLVAEGVSLMIAEAHLHALVDDDEFGGLLKAMNNRQKLRVQKEQNG